MSVITDILSAITGNLGTTIKSILDKFITTDKERLEAQQKIDETIANYSQSLELAAANIVNTEASGNWLQRSWRPLLMLMFGIIIIYEYFISSVLNLPKSNLPSEFWTFLEIGIGGYIIGRSAEKITDTIKS